MFYSVVSINEDVCDGCGQCVIPCQKEIIKIIDKKAKIVDGGTCKSLANCIPNCPVGAIEIKEIEGSYQEIPARNKFEVEKLKSVL